MGTYAQWKWIQLHGDKTLWYWLESFGVLSSTFFGHFNASSLYGELRNGTVSKMKSILFGTFIVIAIALGMMAIPGYLQFGAVVHQNVISSLPSYGRSSVIVATLRLLMALNIIGSYPLLFWNLKISFNHLIFSKWKMHDRMKKLIFFGVNLLIW